MTKGFGFAGRILSVDLSSEMTEDIPTTDYTNEFTGGRGIAAKIYWDSAPASFHYHDPENPLIFMTGPLAGFSGLAGSRWIICGKSPASYPEHFLQGNLGGSWGAYLKFTGYDGIVIRGKAEKPVYLLIKEGPAAIRDAGEIWGKSAVVARTLLKSELGHAARVVATGPAGENLVNPATVLADEDSCGCGFGAVMGSKKLKAVVVLGGGSRPVAARPEELSELRQHIRQLQTRRVFQFVGPPQWEIADKSKLKPQICYGCIAGCSRASYKSADGDEGKLFCQPTDLYITESSKYYGKINDVPFQAIRLCDNYGLDTKVVCGITRWLEKCYQAGILDDNKTGIPLSKIGSLEYIESLVRKMATREGFGDILAGGIRHAAETVGGRASDMITDYFNKAEQLNAYGARMYITTGLLSSMEPRDPIHQLHEISFTASKWRAWARGVAGAYVSSQVMRNIARTFWGSELAADFSTYEGKALAAKMIQDRHYAIECLILCNMLWPAMYARETSDHVGDPNLESRIYSAVTGHQVDRDELYQTGERLFNLHRAIYNLEGHGGRQGDRLAEFEYDIPLQSDVLNPDCLAPGKDGEVISRKGAIIDRDKYEKMLDEYYQLREWDVATGLQTTAKLASLGLNDVAAALQSKGLAV